MNSDSRMSREDVIRHIVHREERAQGLSDAEVLDNAPELHEAACVQFGTWETALQYAGVPSHRLYLKPEVSREQVVRGILFMCRCAGSLHAERFKRRHRKLYEAAKEHFGTWRGALQAAGINLENALLRLQASPFGQAEDRQRDPENVIRRANRFAGKTSAWKIGIWQWPPFMRSGVGRRQCGQPDQCRGTVQ